ncbi:MAG: hypothetical protein M1826_003728 [Phylliscum demangeonii]|nr:MAG: hypothetical protein M1826_003728 [Phylliscum demangeonii]
MDDPIDQFTTITNSTPQLAEQYLRLSEGNLEQAMQLFFDSGGMDLVGGQEMMGSTPASVPAPGPISPPAAGVANPARNVVEIDSDEDEEITDDNDPVVTGWRRTGPSRLGAGESRQPGEPTTSSSREAAVEDDEAIARRLQDEFYAAADEPGGVRAPMARTTETLVGPGANWDDRVDGAMAAAIEAQMAARQQRRSRPGIFNQEAASSSVWEDSRADPADRRQMLAQATGGASEISTKANLLAEMYRPPVELISRLSWDDARQEGRSMEKWMLVNVQDPAIFDCQVLNRDIWKHAGIRETVRENFIFLQYNKDDGQGAQYMQFYFKERDAEDSYPHIAIVDPRTGEQVKVWSGPPVPKATDFMMQLHEFLDLFSLKMNAKNPIASRREEKARVVDVERMTEEQMLEMALQNSLAAAATGAEAPALDDETVRRAPRPTTDRRKGKERARDVDSESPPGTPPLVGPHPPPASTTRTTPTNHSHHASPASPFSLISSAHAHVEPAADPARTTRIQFRHSAGRIIRRFALTDSVRRIYEWLKAAPLEGKAGVEFALVSAGRNLMEHLEESIEQAGLQNQTVMIEFMEEA